MYGLDKTMCENGGLVHGAAANVVAAVNTVISQAGLRIFALGVVGKLTREDVSRYPAEGHVPSLACGPCAPLWQPSRYAGCCLPGCEGGGREAPASTDGGQGWLDQEEQWGLLRALERPLSAPLPGPATGLRE